MRPLLRRCARLAAGVLAIGVCALALVVGAARLASPLVAGQRQAIESLVSEQLGRPVSIEHVQLEWHGLRPDVRLSDVRLYDAGRTRVLLGFQQAVVAPDIGASLLALGPRLAGLRIVGADVRLTRAADGTLSLQGARAGGPASLHGGLDALEDASLRFEDSRLRWRDRVLDVDYQFEDVDLALRTQARRLRLAVRATPPSGLGRRLRLVASFEGDLQRPASWQGRLYVKAARVRAQALPAALVTRTLGIRSARLGGEVWSTWRDGQPVQAVARARLEDVRVACGDDCDGVSQGADLTELAGVAAWQARARGWRAQARELTVVRRGRVWPATTAALAFKRNGQGGASWHARLSALELADTAALAARHPALGDALAARLRSWEPRGMLRAVQFSLTTGAKGIEAYAARASFEDLGWRAHAERPGLAGLDGQLRLDRRHGQLQLDSSDLTVDDPAWLSKSLRVAHLKSTLEWQRGAAGWRVRAPAFELDSAALELSGRASLRLADGVSPYLDLQLAGADIDVADLVDSLSSQGTPPKLAEWLTHSIKSGHIGQSELVFRGHLADFPFRDSQGVIRAWAEVDGATLDYKPGWPTLEKARGVVRLHNACLSARLFDGHVLDSEIEQAHITIDDVTRAELSIEGKAQGPVSDLIDYLGAVGAIEAERAPLDGLHASGPARLELDMRVPLAKDKVQRPKRIAGRLQLEGAALSFDALDLGVRELRGEVRFGPQGTRAQALEARVRGQPVRIDASPTAAGGTRLEMRGRLAASTLLKGLPRRVASALQGETDWLAVVELPELAGAAESQPVSMRLSSRLQGLAVDLPAPLGKPAKSARVFEVKTKVGPGGPYPVRARYGTTVSAALVFGTGDGGAQIERAGLQLSDEPAALPAQGLRVRGRLPELSLDAWLSRLQQLSSNSDPSRAPLPKPVDVNVSVGELRWAGQAFAALDLDLRGPVSGGWWIELDAPAIGGTVAVPDSLAAGRPVIVGLEHLRLSPFGGAPEADASLDPAKLPALRVSVGRLVLAGLDLSQLKLATTPIRDGLQVHELKVSTPSFEGQAVGQWRLSEAGDPHTNLRFKLHSDNLGAALRRWNLPHSLAKGEAKADGYLRWSGTPYRFGFDGLEGRIQVRLKDGRLRELKPGPARLLGLFNVGTLSRRLTLDFTDLFKKGLSFDKIKGDIAIDGSTLSTDDLVLKGPTADIAVKGRTGLVARDYDQRVTVTPHVATGLPLLGALLGGPGVGAALFAVERLADELGASVDQLGRLRYKVTGTWDDPKVEPIGNIAGARARSGSGRDGEGLPWERSPGPR